MEHQTLEVRDTDKYHKIRLEHRSGWMWGTEGKNLCKFGRFVINFAASQKLAVSPLRKIEIDFSETSRPSYCSLIGLFIAHSPSKFTDADIFRPRILNLESGHSTAITPVTGIGRPSG